MFDQVQGLPSVLGLVGPLVSFFPPPSPTLPRCIHWEKLQTNKQRRSETIVSRGGRSDCHGSFAT